MRCWNRRSRFWTRRLRPGHRRVEIVAEGVNRLLGPSMGALVITHYQRLLDYIKPNRISILFEAAWS